MYYDNFSSGISIFILQTIILVTVSYFLESEKIDAIRQKNVI